MRTELDTQRLRGIRGLGVVVKGWWAVPVVMVMCWEQDYKGGGGLWGDLGEALSLPLAWL